MRKKGKTSEVYRRYRLGRLPVVLTQTHGVANMERRTAQCTVRAWIRTKSSKTMRHAKSDTEKVKDRNMPVREYNKRSHCSMKANRYERGLTLVNVNRDEEIDKINTNYRRKFTIN